MNLSVNHNTKLYQMLEHLHLLIGESRLWMKAYIEIGLNANRLRELNFEQVFGVFQRASFNMLAVDVYNIYDDDFNYDIISIPKIITEIKQEKYFLVSPQGFVKELKKLGITIPINDENLVLRALDEICKRRPNFKNDPALRQVKHTRDNFIAHKNYSRVSTTITKSLTKESNFERLFKWAEDFRSIIYKGYFPLISPENIYDWSDEHSQNITRLMKFVLSANLDSLIAEELFNIRV